MCIEPSPASFSREPSPSSPAPGVGRPQYQPAYAAKVMLDSISNQMRTLPEHYVQVSVSCSSLVTTYSCRGLVGEKKAILAVGHLGNKQCQLNDGNRNLLVGATTWIRRQSLGYLAVVCLKDGTEFGRFLPLWSPGMEEMRRHQVLCTEIFATYSIPSTIWNNP